MRSLNLAFVLYFTVKKHLDQKQSDAWDYTHKKREKCDALLKLNMPRFSHNQVSLEEILDLISQKCNLQSGYDKTRNQQKVFNHLLKDMCVVIVMLVTPSHYFVSLLAVCVQFTSMITNIFSLMNQNTHAQSEYDGLNKKLNSTDKYVEYEQKTFRGHILTKCVIKRGQFCLTMDGQLSLNTESIVLIRGSSGSGKTTFINHAITGYATIANQKGTEIVLNNGLYPANYRSEMSILFQGANPNWGALSFAELFDTQDESIIGRLLIVAQVSKLMDRLKEKHTQWIQTPLSELGEISGGERRRVAIALQLFNLEKGDKKILVLDEPEQGSDPDAAVAFIQEIIRIYAGRCGIIIISHLERFGVQGDDRFPDKSGINWTDKILVKDGVALVTSIKINLLG